MDADAIIDGARTLDDSFSKTRHLKRSGLEFLSRYQRELAGKVLSRDSRIISQEISFSLPLAVFADGITLQTGAGPFVELQYDRIHGIDAEQTNLHRLPVGIIPWKSRNWVRDWPAVTQRENVLLLLGHQSWWAQFINIHVEYAPTPQPVTLGADELVFPDSALNALVLALGSEWCKRSPDACARKTLPAEAEKAEMDFLDLIDERNDVEVGTVRRVFS